MDPIVVLIIITIIAFVIGGYFAIKAIAKNSVAQEIREIKKFTGDFNYPLIPIEKNNDPFTYMMVFQMKDFYVRVDFRTGLRDDGTFNYNRCFLRGINSSSGISLPLGTDLGHIYFNTENLIKQIGGRGLNVSWYNSYEAKYWKEIEKKVNILNTCVNIDEEKL